MNVKITDMKEFLQAVDSCTGDVYLVYPRGGTENIRLNPMRQAELVDECYIIGDCGKVGKIYDAMNTGYYSAMRV